MLLVIIVTVIVVVHCCVLHIYIHIYIYIYIYTLDIYMICEHILLITFLNKPELFFAHIKWSQVFLYDSHNLTSVICLHTVCSFWPIDRALWGAATLGQSRHGSNRNEGLLHIPQISKARPSPSDCLMSYPGHSLRGTYTSAEMQSVYSTAQPTELHLFWDDSNNFLKFGWIWTKNGGA